MRTREEDCTEGSRGEGRRRKGEEEEGRRGEEDRWKGGEERGGWEKERTGLKGVGKVMRRG